VLVSNRSRRGAPNLNMLDGVVLALTTRFVSPHRIAQLAAGIKPATLLKTHKLLADHKRRRLFSSSSHRHNPHFGCGRIAQRISYALGSQVEKDGVRCLLAR
jgi:hypothetical protein